MSYLIGYLGGIVINETTYELIDDPEEICAIFDISKSPFNLRKCLKLITEAERQSIRPDIVAEVTNGPGRSSCVVLFGKEHQRLCCIYKLRIALESHGKSSGLRVYCLVLPIYKYIILLGITIHKRGEDNLTNDAKQALHELCKKVVADIKKEEGIK